MPTREHDCEHCRHWHLDPGQINGLANAADVLANLGSILRAVRERAGQSQRAAAKQIGVSFSTVSRAEVGGAVDGINAAKIMRWIAQPGDQEGTGQ
jgi:DNA-binding XRE family transcriptional regulator